MTRRLALILLTFLLATAIPAVAAGDDGDHGGDNNAVAVNYRDGSSLFRFAFRISQERGDVVDNQNAAVAYSRCEGCRTSAIALQVVLITDDASTVTPTNLALAVNDQCTSCATFASAYQFVRSTDGPVRFTSEGRREIASIKHDVRELRDEELSPPELQARVAAAADRLRTVIDTELVPAGDGGDEGVADENDRSQRQLAPGDRPTTRSKVEKEFQGVRR